MRADPPWAGAMRCGGLLLASLLAVGAALAAGGGPAWQRLDAARQALLAPFADHWDRLPPAQRQQLLDNAARWQKLDPVRQARLQQRWQRWQALTPFDRARLRRQHAALQRLPEAEQLALRATHAAHQALPKAERDALRGKFAALDAAQRRDYLLPDPQQTLLDLAGDVFAFVPAGEQAATLALLEPLDARQREQLHRLARRMPPWQREAMRQEWLAVPEGERAAWLQQRLR